MLTYGERNWLWRMRSWTFFLMEPLRCICIFTLRMNKCAFIIQKHEHQEKTETKISVFPTL